MIQAAAPLPEPVDRDALLHDCIESFGARPSGHPDMWRSWYRLLGHREPRGASHWLYVWSYVRWADDLLDQASAESEEAQAEMLRWGMGRLRSLLEGGAAENIREQAIRLFLEEAGREDVELFFRVTAAAEYEKSQLRGPPSQAELDLIIEHNAVLPVLLHCRLFLRALGFRADAVEQFGLSFGQVTRYVDVFVDLDEDLDDGIVPISREACARRNLDSADASSPSGQAIIRDELRREYEVHRGRAQEALDRMGADRLVRFAYGVVLQAFDRCVYGPWRIVPGFSLFLFRYVDQAIPLAGFVLRSIAVSMSERHKVRD